MKDVNATVILDINGKSEEEVLRSFDYSRRKNINKAMRKGLVIEEASSEKDYKKCYEMYSQTIKEGGATPFSYPVWMDWAKKEGWDLFVIKKGKKKVGYFSVIKITKRYYGLDSEEVGVRPRVFASDKKYAEDRVTDLIYWGTILYGINNKVSYVDLGGYQLKPRGHLKGVNNFKEKWGGEVFLYYLDYSFLVGVARKLIRNVGFFWYINELLKKFRQKPPKAF